MRHRRWPDIYLDETPEAGLAAISSCADAFRNASRPEILLHETLGEAIQALKACTDLMRPMRMALGLALAKAREEGLGSDLHNVIGGHAHERFRKWDATVKRWDPRIKSLTRLRSDLRYVTSLYDPVGEATALREEAAVFYKHCRPNIELAFAHFAVTVEVYSDYFGVFSNRAELEKELGAYARVRDHVLTQS